MTSLAMVNDNGCIGPFPDGSLGQVMMQTAGGPAWVDQSEITGAGCDCPPAPADQESATVQGGTIVALVTSTNTPVPTTDVVFDITGSFTGGGVSGPLTIPFRGYYMVSGYVDFQDAATAGNVGDPVGVKVRYNGFGGGTGEPHTTIIGYNTEKTRLSFIEPGPILLDVGMTIDLLAWTEVSSSPMPAIELARVNATLILVE